jgi:tRNA nucleotidyltransferase/poly(A) polymerase
MSSNLCFKKPSQMMLVHAKVWNHCSKVWGTDRLHQIFGVLVEYTVLALILNPLNQTESKTGKFNTFPSKT